MKKLTSVLCCVSGNNKVFGSSRRACSFLKSKLITTPLSHDDNNNNNIRNFSTGILSSFHSDHSYSIQPPATQTPPTSSPTSAKPASNPLPGIKHIIVVSSGKGGVGKSTVATNLALALSSFCQKSVGLMDADIYGPSIHRMMNVSGKPNMNEETRKIIPKSNYGVRVMSMGFLVQEDAPTIWRGPMVMGAVDQLLTQVEWGELDILVIDLPPGTGEFHFLMWNDSYTFASQ